MVIADEIQSVEKTQKAVALLKAVGAYDDVQRAIDSTKIRTGSGKARNRRYVQRRGPLIVYSDDNGVTRAFRNLPGVDLVNVSALNLLQLAPGGHLGRFVIFSESAFKKLDSIFGTTTEFSEQKKGFKLPRGTLAIADLDRLINSDEIQSVIRDFKAVRSLPRQKKNPLKNLNAMLKLNPYHEKVLEDAKKLQEAAAASKAKTGLTPSQIAKKKSRVANAAASQAKYQRIIAEEEYSVVKSK